MNGLITNAPTSGIVTVSGQVKRFTQLALSTSGGRLDLFRDELEDDGQKHSYPLYLKQGVGGIELIDGAVYFFGDVDAACEEFRNVLLSLPKREGK